jgi:hypothetical protein
LSNFAVFHSIKMAISKNGEGSQKAVLREILGTEKKKATGGCRKWHTVEFRDL